MAMVNAIKNGHVIKVSKKSYDAMFKDKGYVIVENDMTEETMERKAEEVEQEEDVIETIPISEMNKRQLMEYAKKHGIDTSSAKNMTEARHIIQKAARELKM